MSKAETLRLIGEKFQELSELYLEMADLAEKEEPTKEEDDRMTFLTGKLLQIQVEMSKLSNY